MGHDESIIFQKTYGVLTPALRQMRDDMLCRGVKECAMESTAVYWIPVWNELYGSMVLKLVNPYFKSIFHQAVARPQERCQGCPVDSGMRPEKSYQGKLCARSRYTGHAQT